MNKLFYFRLAAQNLRKNGKFYIPYLLAGIGNVMMFYIMVYLRTNPAMENHESLGIVLGLGTVVIAIFSSVFIFYTNSFLMKRRKKEIGLFNILGMEKKHIACVLSAETLYTALISIGGGIGLGILFSKLFLLLMTKIMGYSVEFGFSVSVLGIASTAAVFCAIFFLALLYNLGRIHLSKPVELLSSSSVGEKEPKVKWPIALLGVITLAAGYILALKIETPTTAFLMFFAAVILVIIGTYCLFCACSIAVLKMLRKNKGFYYKLKNFTTVSGMMYRMKQNAVGLANICILSTMLLVTVSTTVSLYIGAEDSLRNEFPRDIIVRCSAIEEEDFDGICEEMRQSVVSCGGEMLDTIAYRFDVYTVGRSGGVFDMYGGDEMRVCRLVLVPLSEYIRNGGENIGLDGGEVLYYSPNVPWTYNECEFRGYSGEGVKLTVKKTLDDLVFADEYYYDDPDICYFIVKDDSVLCSLAEVLFCDEDRDIERYYIAPDALLEFDVDGPDGMQNRILTAFIERLGETSDYEYNYILPRCVDDSRQDFMSIFGGLFFIGIFLGSLFAAAAVLIIYYKQISEGYEDKKRFEIMQKVGMSRREVKRSIRAQVLMVFFLPLVTSFVHLAFSFNMISRMISIVGFTNVPLFVCCTAATALAFAILYAVVYARTARIYYKIVESPA